MHNTQQRQPSRSAAAWQETIEAWQRSGLSGVAYAAQHNLAAHNLYKWGARLRQTGRTTEAAATASTRPSPLFVPVEVVMSRTAAADDPVAPAGLTLELPSGAVLRLQGPVGVDLVTAILRLATEVRSC